MASSPSLTADADDRLQALLARLQCLDSYLAVDPHNPRLLAEAFETAMHAGAFDRAETFLMQVRASGTDVAAWQFKEANLRMAQGRLDEARQVARHRYASRHQPESRLHRLLAAAAIPSLVRLAATLGR